MNRIAKWFRPSPAPIVAPPEPEEGFFQPHLGLEIAPYIAAGDMLGLHHLARYQWAQAVLCDLQPQRV